MEPYHDWHEQYSLVIGDVRTVCSTVPIISLCCTIYRLQIIIRQQVFQVCCLCVPQTSTGGGSDVSSSDDTSRGPCDVSRAGTVPPSNISAPSSRGPCDPPQLHPMINSSTFDSSRGIVCDKEGSAKMSGSSFHNKGDHKGFESVTSFLNLSTAEDRLALKSKGQDPHIPLMRDNTFKHKPGKGILSADVQNHFKNVLHLALSAQSSKFPKGISQLKQTSQTETNPAPRSPPQSNALYRETDPRLQPIKRPSHLPGQINLSYHRKQGSPPDTQCEQGSDQPDLAPGTCEREGESSPDRAPQPQAPLPTLSSATDKAQSPPSGQNMHTRTSPSSSTEVCSPRPRNSPSQTPKGSPQPDDEPFTESAKSTNNNNCNSNPSGLESKSSPARGVPSPPPVSDSVSDLSSAYHRQAGTHGRHDNSTTCSDSASQQRGETAGRSERQSVSPSPYASW